VKAYLWCIEEHLKGMERMLLLEKAKAPEEEQHLSQC
jgi:hypothetical protein